MLNRSPIVRVMASRLMLREQPPGRAARRLLWGSAVVVVASAGPVLLGVHHLALVAVAGLASLGVLVGICLRLFLPAMAVSVVGVALACSSLMTALSVTAGFEQEIVRALARLNGHVLLTKYGLDFFEYEEVATRWRADPEVTAASPFAYSTVAVVPAPDEGEGEGGAVAGGAGEGEAGEGEALEGEAGEGEAGAGEAGAVGDSSDAEPSEAPPAGPVVVLAKGLDPARAAELDGFTEVLGHGDPSALRPGDTRHLPGIVLGVGLAARLGVKEGERIRVVVPAEIGGEGQPVGEARFATFELLDVLTTGTSEVDRSMALMHISAAQALFFRERRVTGIELELAHPEQADAFAARMSAELPPLYRVSTWRETNAPLLIGLQQIRVVLSLVLGLMVVVAASSLIASLLLIVRRKRHDIAVIMAVGGARSLVFWVFEAVGLMAGAVGAALGLSLGGLYCWVIDSFRYPLGSDIYPVDHLPVVIRAIDVLGPAAAAIALCGVASGPVAAMAARVGVIAALRR